MNDKLRKEDRDRKNRHMREKKEKKLERKYTCILKRIKTESDVEAGREITTKKKLKKYTKQEQGDR